MFLHFKKSISAKNNSCEQVAIIFDEPQPGVLASDAVPGLQQPRGQPLVAGLEDVEAGVQQRPGLGLTQSPKHTTYFKSYYL